MGIYLIMVTHLSSLIHCKQTAASCITMLDVIAGYLKDLSVLRKLMFAATHLPPELPEERVCLL